MSDDIERRAIGVDNKRLIVFAFHLGPPGGSHGFLGPWRKDQKSLHRGSEAFSVSNFARHSGVVATRSPSATSPSASASTMASRSSSCRSGGESLKKLR